MKKKVWLAILSKSHGVCVGSLVESWCVGMRGHLWDWYNWKCLLCLIFIFDSCHTAADQEFPMYRMQCCIDWDIQIGLTCIQIYFSDHHEVVPIFWMHKKGWFYYSIRKHYVKYQNRSTDIVDSFGTMSVVSFFPFTANCLAPWNELMVVANIKTKYT